MLSELEKKQMFDGIRILRTEGARMMRALYIMATIILAVLFSLLVVGLMVLNEARKEARVENNEDLRHELIIEELRDRGFLDRE